MKWNVLLQLVEFSVIAVLVFDGANLLDLFVALRVGHHDLLTLACGAVDEWDVEVAVYLLYIASMHVML